MTDTENAKERYSLRFVESLGNQMLMISILGAIKKKSVQCVVQKWLIIPSGTIQAMKQSIAQMVVGQSKHM